MSSLPLLSKEDALSIREMSIAFSKMSLCLKYLTVFFKTEKLNKLMHFHHKNEKLYIPVVLKRLMTGMIWGAHVGPAFLLWVVLIKKYLNLNLLVFVPEMEISELNSLYSPPHVI